MRWGRVVCHMLTVAATAAVAVCVLGLLLRDRVPLLAMLSYLPFVMIAVAVLMWDFFRRGRAWPRVRFGLSAVAMSVIFWYAGGMIGWPSEPVPVGPKDVRLVQWNVWWGAGRGSPPERWEAVVNQVVALRPDVIVLSEAPTDERLSVLTRRLGGEWWTAQIEHESGNRDWYRIVVASRFPRGRQMERLRLADGHALHIDVLTPSGPLRILAADGPSAPWRDRLPMLEHLTAAATGSDDGRRVDIIAGDLNAPGRSAGFDALRAAGAVAASGSGFHWRGTWPWPLPLYDIDHVWVVPGRWGLVSCAMLQSPYLDHRGHLVILRPEE